MKYVLLCFLILLGKSGIAQTDSIKRNTTSLEEVVITATRTKKNLDRIPIPVTQISAKEIKDRGMVRLNEILAEQTGLAIINNHGMGIQMQGFDSDYTMILIDGEPVIGRTSGTLELSRIAVGNIDRIEIIKGPSSSLYGSEAMAGVINVITKEPNKGINYSLSTRYGTNNSSDVSLDGSFKNEKISVSGFLNRNSSDGYSLQPLSGANTVSPFESYTFWSKVNYKSNKKLLFNLSTRYFNDYQQNRYPVDNRPVAGNGKVKELNVSPSVSYNFSNKHHSMLRFHHSSYQTHSTLNYDDSQEIYDQTFFKQVYNKLEHQNDYLLLENLKLTGGAGIQVESVEATRYEKIQSFTSGFGYLQADWLPTPKLNLLLGGRFDAHSEYKSQFSPKIAVSHQTLHNLVIFGSVGKGYKAPDFRQLYLNFSNTVAGYSVFGYSEAAEQLTHLQEQGQVQTILIEPSLLSQLNAESSISYNFGFRFKPLKSLSWNVNIFRNDIKNMIESVPVAIKTNGQSVFSYSNLNEIFTQGIETDLSFQLSPLLEIAGGFQFLQAYDKEVLNKIDKGEIYQRDQQNNTRMVTRKDYGGLVNRSPYMANLRMTFRHEKTGTIASLRGFYRGKYGLGDSNGNGIIDADNEYVKGYFLLNASVSKFLMKNTLRLQLTSENILNYTDPTFISNLPGRLFYLGISYKFSKQ